MVFCIGGKVLGVRGVLVVEAGGLRCGPEDSGKWRLLIGRRKLML